MKVKFYVKQGLIGLAISLVISLLTYYFFNLSGKDFADLASPAMFIKKGLKAAGVILIIGSIVVSVLSFFMPLMISENEVTSPQTNVQHPELEWDSKCLIFSKEYMNIKVEPGKNHPALVAVERISSSISLEKESNALSKGIVTEDEEVNNFFNTIEVNGITVNATEVKGAEGLKDIVNTLKAQKAEDEGKEEKNEVEIPPILDVDNPLIEEPKEQENTNPKTNFVDKNNIDDMY